MNPYRRKKMKEAEEAYGRPFWEQVRLFAEQGMSRCRTAELMGYSKEGFLGLLASPEAPDDLPWWTTPITLLHQGATEPETRERIRETIRRQKGVWITHQGETLHVSDWAERTGLSADTIRTRYRDGRRGSALFDKPMSRQERGRRGLAVRRDKEGAA